MDQNRRRRGLLARAERGTIRLAWFRPNPYSVAIHTLLIPVVTRRYEAASDSFDGTPPRKFFRDQNVFAISDPH